MSVCASLADRLRDINASIATLERAVEEDPHDFSLQINLSAARKMARLAEEDLTQAARDSFVEVCRYRLVPADEESYGLSHVSRSFLSYQLLFSQIYDAIRNETKKEKAKISKEAMRESMLEFGYTFSGSLGLVLLIQSDRDLLEGRFDKAIEAMLQLVEIADPFSVRDVARTLGNAVVRRAYDWSEANVIGGFSADLVWSRTDGRVLGRAVDKRHMEDIMAAIESATDETAVLHNVRGQLVGADIPSKSFHFLVSADESYKGTFSEQLEMQPHPVLMAHYAAKIISLERTFYATDKVEKKYVLAELTPLDVG